MTLIRRDFDDCLTLTSGPLILMWYRREVRQANGYLINPPQFFCADLINWNDAEEMFPEDYELLVSELQRQRSITVEGFVTA